MKPKLFQCASGSTIEAYACPEGIGQRVAGENLPSSGAAVQLSVVEASAFREFISELLDDRFERYGDTGNGRAA